MFEFTFLNLVLLTGGLTVWVLGLSLSIIALADLVGRIADGSR